MGISVAPWCSAGAAGVAAPPFCRATVIDRNVWRQTGALAGNRTASGLALIAALPASQDRPWAR